MNLLTGQIFKNRPDTQKTPKKGSQIVEDAENLSQQIRLLIGLFSKNDWLSLASGIVDERKQANQLIWRRSHIS